MDELFAVRYPREVYVEPVGVFTVPPASVETAVRIFTMGESALDGNGPSDARIAVQRAAYSWLPFPLYATLFSEAFEWSTRVQLLTHLISAGLPEGAEGKVEDAEEHAKEKAASRSWHSIIAGYRKQFGLSFEEVMNEGWHVFVCQMFEVDGLKAREEMRWTDSYRRARIADEADSKKVRERQLERAGIDPKPTHSSADSAKYTPPWEQMGISKEAYKRRKRHEIARMKERLSKN